MEKKITYKTGTQFLFLGGKTQFFNTKKEAFEAAKEEGSSFILQCENLRRKPKFTLISWNTVVSSKDALKEIAKERYGENVKPLVYDHPNDTRNPAYFLLNFKNKPLIVSLKYFQAYWAQKNPFE